MRISPVPRDSQLAHQMLPSDYHDRVTPVYLTRLTEETFWCLQNFTYIPVADEAPKKPATSRPDSLLGAKARKFVRESVMKSVWKTVFEHVSAEEIPA
jgi:hypothetical protein